MITKDQNKACRIVGEEALLNTEWQEYGKYCLNREKGLRKKAFTHLDSFLKLTLSWDFSQKQSFVQWLCDKMDTISNADYGPYPTPLLKKLFSPVFDEWIEKEPNNAKPYSLKAQYAADFDSYYDAIKIDPNNQRARLALARECIHAIWYSTHHLPEYFIGKEEEMLAKASEAEEHIAFLSDGPLKDDVLNDLCIEVQLLRDWMQFKSEGVSDFDQWCKDKGRRYEWIRAYYYDK